MGGWGGRSLPNNSRGGGGTGCPDPCCPWVLIPPNQLSVTVDPGNYKTPASGSSAPLHIMAAPRGEGSSCRELGGCGGLWGALRGHPQALLPCSCPCPMLGGYSLLPPPLSLLEPSVSATWQLPGGQDTGPLLGSGCGVVGGQGWGAAVLGPLHSPASPCPPRTLGCTVLGMGEDEDGQNPTLPLPVCKGTSPHVPQPLSSSCRCPRPILP